MPLMIRDETNCDQEAVRLVNRLAFGQDAEARLVDALRHGGFARLSLVAEKDGQVVGHVLFSDLAITAEGGTVAALALAPMAVLPDLQRQGIGSALVRRALEVCRERGHRIVVILGHPHFYRRFGFSSALAARLEAPYSGEAFMALELVPGTLAGVTGKVEYAPPFHDLESQGRVTTPPRRLPLLTVPGRFAVCRLRPDDPVPAWATARVFCSITRTLDELSVVCPEDVVPPDVRSEKGWRCLRVAGTIDFSAIGVLASLVAPLAQAGVSVFAISSFDTDYLLVKEDAFAAACAALRDAGHPVD
jgi:putative acetyltransferase